MKTALYLVLFLCLPLQARWWGDDDSRGFHSTDVRIQDVQVKELTFAEQQYQAAFGVMEHNAAMRQQFLKAQRESPDFKLFAPINAPILENVIKPSHVNEPKPLALQPVKIEEMVVQGIKQPSGWRSALKGAVRAIGEAFRAVAVGIRQVVNVVTGQIFGILSGDIFKRQEPIHFDSVPGHPAVISINGMLNSHRDAKVLNAQVRKAFGVDQAVIIRNDTGLFRFFSDTLQVIGYEVLGARDKPVESTIKALKQGIQEKGAVFVVAHSQGTAIFALALRGLTKEERSKVHYYGAGGEWFVDGKKAGLASARNVRNAGDLIPNVGNKYNPTNFFNPAHYSRINGNWDRINVKAIGNEHSFQSYYAGDMAEWAKKMMAEKP